MVGLGFSNKMNLMCNRFKNKMKNFEIKLFSCFWTKFCEK